MSNIIRAHIIFLILLFFFFSHYYTINPAVPETEYNPPSSGHTYHPPKPNPPDEKPDPPYNPPDDPKKDPPDDNPNTNQSKDPQHPITSPIFTIYCNLPIPLRIGNNTINAPPNKATTESMISIIHNNQTYNYTTAISIPLIKPITINNTPVLYLTDTHSYTIYAHQNCTLIYHP